MENKYIIQMKLPSLNDYINVCRSNPKYANKYKAQLEYDIGLFLMKMPKWNNPVKINFTWVETNKKRDLDNVAFAKKFILDAMVRFGKLKDDNQRYVKGFTDSFRYEKEASVILEIEEVEDE